MAELLGCRYCGALTEFRHLGDQVYQLFNPDGSLHQCRERERSQAIPVIFGTEVDTACEPLCPEEVLDQLQEVYAWAGVFVIDESKLYALNAAIEVMKLVMRKEGGGSTRILKERG